MTRHLFTSALFAGLAAGIIAAALQLIFAIPLLLEGELYESGIRVHFAASLDSAVQSPSGPAEGLSQNMSRHLTTLGFNMVAYTAFALILVAAMALVARYGHSVTPKAGLVWGLAGFIALHLAPAFGLPPEMPGSIAVEIAQRQMWWIMTVFLTTVGLASIAFGSSIMAWAIGVLCLALPHIIGAPHLDTYYGIAPPELASQYVTRSLGVAAASWTVLGLFAAYFWSRGKQAMDEQT